MRSIVEIARDVGLGQLTALLLLHGELGEAPEEVEGLMRLHAEMIDAEVPTLHKNDCARGLRGPVGRAEPPNLRGRMEWAEGSDSGQPAHDPASSPSTTEGAGR